MSSLSPKNPEPGRIQDPSSEFHSTSDFVLLPVPRESEHDRLSSTVPASELRLEDLEQLEDSDSTTTGLNLTICVIGRERCGRTEIVKACYNGIIHETLPHSSMYYDAARDSLLRMDEHHVTQKLYNNTLSAPHAIHESELFLSEGTTQRASIRLLDSQGREFNPKLQSEKKNRQRELAAKEEELRSWFLSHRELLKPVVDRLIQEEPTIPAPQLTPYAEEQADSPAETEPAEQDDPYEKMIRSSEMIWLVVPCPPDLEEANLDLFQNELRIARSYLAEALRIRRKAQNPCAVAIVFSKIDIFLGRAWAEAGNDPELLEQSQADANGRHQVRARQWAWEKLFVSESEEENLNQLLRPLIDLLKKDEMVTHATVLPVSAFGMGKAAHVPDTPEFHLVTDTEEEPEAEENRSPFFNATYDSEWVLPPRKCAVPFGITPLIVYSLISSIHHRTAAGCRKKTLPEQTREEAEKTLLELCQDFERLNPLHVPIELNHRKKGKKPSEQMTERERALEALNFKPFTPKTLGAFLQERPRREAPGA